MKYFWIIVTLSIFIFSGCKDKIEDIPSDICQKEVLIDDELYKDAPDDPHKIEKVELFEDCLEIEISAGGGCGEWAIQLVSSKISVQNTMDIPYRSLRISLLDEDACKALIHESTSFDLRPFQKENHGSTRLRIEGWNEEIVYQY